VGKLAKTLGHPLFEQVGKKLFLTEAGQVTLRLCRDVFDALNRAQMTLADMSGLKQGRFRLCVVTTAEYFAPRVLGAFSERYPEVDLELLILNRRLLLSRLRENMDDLYILGQPPEGLDVTATAFLNNPQIPLAARHHHLAGQRAVPLEVFAREPMIIRESGSGTRKAVELFFKQEGLRPRIKMELGSNEAIKQAVAGGLGVTILSRHCVSLAGDTPLLAMLDVQGLPLQRQWHVVHPRTKELSPVARTFLDFLLSPEIRLNGP
jgi:LysR family transcriptional regulator, low CO2-responsive transcriptional regulator